MSQCRVGIHADGVECEALLNRRQAIYHVILIARLIMFPVLSFMVKKSSKPQSSSSSSLTPLSIGSLLDKARACMEAQFPPNCELALKFLEKAGEVSQGQRILYYL